MPFALLLFPVHRTSLPLSPTQLYQNRDLAATTDFRDVYAEIARKHLGLTDMATLFPGYSVGPGVGLLP